MIDRTDEFPWDLWNRMAELGILGMTTPPEYGGSGMDVVSWAIAQEEMARASVVVADIQLLSTLMQKMILQNGTEAQKAKYVPPLVSGEKIAILAQTEPGAGSDVAGIQTTAKPERNGYVLNGTKRFLTCAMLADFAIVVATVDKSRGHKGITLFLVEKGMPGFSPGSKEHLMGVKGRAQERWFAAGSKSARATFGTRRPVEPRSGVPISCCTRRRSPRSSGRWRTR